MRPTPWLAAEAFRQPQAGMAPHRYGDDYGAFLAPSPVDSGALRIIASAGMSDVPWEHVSVSRANRCPNWPEMCFVKDLFWLPEETVVQFHPPASVYVNQHPYCLHLWRPLGRAIPLPPTWTVGLTDVPA